jgi:hypothetical protein
MTDPTPSVPAPDDPQAAIPPEVTDQDVDTAGTEADDQSAAGRALREDRAPEDDPTAGRLGER